ncbi:MAG: DUF262 domain-containing protein [Bacteroidetes bacterium]|nr:MAG: DUF262 domain-containing protein [Bacteroidota bacterium]
MCESLEKNNIELKTLPLGDLLGLELNSNDENKPIIPFENDYNLAIPDYQRIYCWDEKNVIKLLEDINDYADKKYHLGTIILHKKDNKYDIVDGQQRLVTLSLLLLELNKNINTKILNEKFKSIEAQNYIAYNKWLIKVFCEKNNIISNIIDNLQFSVLIINEGSLDLAYTFFSNQNSRGKSLTDYDLLKAHHLRYIYIPEQAKHLAERWDSIILSSDNDDCTKDLGRTLGIYLFRLRKWMQKQEWSNDKKHKVKDEFEAAPIINGIPPFGEQFQFYESIQGGTHFFAYADYFIYKYRMFSETNEYKTLQKHLQREKHWWYKDIIEAFLFAYYIKFGTIYLTDALIGIIHIISKHRYDTSRAYLKSLLKMAGDSELIMMIDQATSPTFFLAKMKNIIKRQDNIANFEGTRMRYKYHVEKIIKEIKIDCYSIINY